MTAAPQLGWLLDDLVARVPPVDKAAILSRDGLTVGTSALAKRLSDLLAVPQRGGPPRARGPGGGPRGAPRCAPPPRGPPPPPPPPPPHGPGAT
jgi:hypothetical protein